ncbi:MAG TPA: hypothetical protein DCQ93_03960 [Bacteroidetes bacterium]|nr:hypothetical protein [Bacteroidota bacterium]
MSIFEFKNHHYKKNGSKYQNKKVVIGPHTFDSKKESKRYLELSMMQNKNIISNLKTQVPYELKVNGVLICKYIADFAYESRIITSHNGSWKEKIVEDVKGFRRTKYRDASGKVRTRTNPAYEMFLLKKKLMKAIHNIDVIEI